MVQAIIDVFPGLSRIDIPPRLSLCRVYLLFSFLTMTSLLFRDSYSVPSPWVLFISQEFPIILSGWLLLWYIHLPWVRSIIKMRSLCPLSLIPKMARAVLGMGPNPYSSHACANLQGFPLSSRENYGLAWFPDLLSIYRIIGNRAEKIGIFYNILISGPSWNLIGILPITKGYEWIFIDQRLSEPACSPKITLVSLYIWQWVFGPILTVQISNNLPYYRHCSSASHKSLTNFW